MSASLVIEYTGGYYKNGTPQRTFMDLPSDLAPYQKEAQRLLSEKAVKDVEFSGPTYQILIEALGERAWIFLSLNPLGKIEDLFCPLEELDTSSLFKAIAYLWVYRQQKPYHVRYQYSFWRKAAELFYEAFGEKEVKEKEVGHFSLFDSHNTCGIEIVCKEGKRGFFEGVLYERQEETEETSLKFSRLSLPELELWRKGTPSPMMRFELSLWNDLCKRLFFAEEREEDFQLEFILSENQLPLQAKGEFSFFSLSLLLSEKQLEQLIPFLRSVRTNLEIFVPSEAPIEKISFDPQSILIQVKRSYRQVKKEELDQEKRIGDWFFVAPKRLYHKNFVEKPLQEEYDHSQIDYFLSTLTEEQWHLLNVPYNKNPLPLQYFLEFDQDWNLHIYAYLHVPKDLQKRDACLFSQWVFLPDSGFQAIQSSQFHRKQTVIFKENISSFVTEMQAWLADKEGFQTHLASLATRIGYTFLEEKGLYFHHIVEKKEEGRVRDFGRWTFVENLGFYKKTSQPVTLPVGNKIPIAPPQIPHFIDQNESDLQVVSRFFRRNNPVKGASISVSFQDNIIHTDPVVEFEEGVDANSVKFFGPYTYIEGEGFYKLSAQQLLPEKWRYPRQFPERKWQAFFEEEWEAIRAYVFNLPLELQPPKTIELVVHEGKKEESFLHLALSYRSELGEVSLFEVANAVHKGLKYLCTKAGLLHLEEHRFLWLQKLSKHHFEKGNLRFSITEFFRLDAIETLKLEGKNIEELLKRIKEQKTLSYPNLALLKSSLRPYQQAGVNWLWFLYKQELSGLLCDEMGLGKTHQAMALFAAVFQEKKERQEKSRFLIVCPTSVLFHWAEKIKEHLAEIPFFLYHGTNRDKEALLHTEGHIVLTSYGILRRELDLFKNFSFDIAVYDEIHIAKNHDSRLHKSLRVVRAKMQLGLTGTPVENNLKELKALFDILLPGYMPSRKEFEQWYIKPIEKEHMGERRQVLNRFIAPFFLRRSKKQVLQDLPAKQESIYHTALSEEQLQLYNQLLYQERTRVLAEYDETGRRGYMQVFALISKLKQICDHPALYYGDLENYEKYTSGKWELLTEFLEQVKESGQKVVIFSQYLGMLSLIKRHCEKKKLGFASIEGKTKDRQEQVRRFQEDPSCSVFAGSLLASGVGIDLTSASYVVHYDRWWNPAKENQATDRVHRIGLKHGVEVYKLVTKHTIEERIHTILEEKRRLFREVVEASETSWFRTLNLEEVRSLFEDASLPISKPF